MKVILCSLLILSLCLPAFSRSRDAHSEGAAGSIESIDGSEWKPRNKKQQKALAHLLDLGVMFETETIQVSYGWSIPGGYTTACQYQPGGSSASKVSQVVVTGLDFVGKPIDDDAIEALEEFPYLERLDLSNSQVTDDSLIKLIKDLSSYSLRHMKELVLTHTTITDKSMKYIERIEKLEGLYLAETRVTSAGIGELKKLNDLRHLDLASTRVTDHCTPALASLRSLENLVLTRTRVSNQGLKYIVKLRKLKSLNLSSTKVTDPAKAKLRQVLKGCSVS